MNLFWHNQKIITFITNLFSLKKRIFIGYIITLIVFATIAIITFYNNKKTLDTFDDFSRYSNIALDASHFETNVVKLELAATNYIRSSIYSGSQKVIHLYSGLERELFNQKNEEYNKVFLNQLSSMQENLKSYINAFNKVVHQKEIYDTLINKKLPLLSQNIIRKLNNNVQNTSEFMRLKNLFVQIERNTYRYFHTFNKDDLSELKKNLKEIKNISKKHDIYTKIEDFDIYSKLLLEAVQRARGYLYLTNVVMSSEAYEILYQSKKMTKILQLRMSNTKKVIIENMKDYNRLLGIVLIIFFLFMVLMAYIMGSSVTQPLKSLSILFKEMIAGSKQQIELIYKPQDELSDLIDAAEIFRNKNIAMHDLIKKHEKLNKTLEKKVLERTVELEKKNKILELLSHTDDLTKINNRLKINQSIDMELKSFKRYGHTFSLIMLDIDYFKNINDTYGHQVGDEVLCQVSTILKENIRKSDTLGRWGGEEFMILCPEISLENAVQIAEKIRKKIESFPFDNINQLTVSIGVILYDDRYVEKEKLLLNVDTALYNAKKSGRNCIKVH